jgi:excisionase family DNA binding protein
VIAPRRTQHPTPLQPQKLFYTVREYAQMSGVGVSTLYRHLREGTFEGKHHRSGSSYRISKAWADSIFRPNG